jgi:hypothetical protein
LVLVGMQDIGVVPIKKIGDGSNQPLTIGAIDKQGSSVFHDSGLRRCKGGNYTDFMLESDGLWYLLPPE